MMYPDSPGYSDHDTSKAAAKSIEPAVGEIAGKVLASITVKPQTCFEIENALELSHQTASARITELHLKGLIIDSGMRRVTGSGRQAKVWRDTTPLERAASAAAKAAA